VATIAAALGWLAGLYVAPSLPPLDLLLGVGLATVAALLGWLWRSAPSARLGAVALGFLLLAVPRGQAAAAAPVASGASVADWAAAGQPVELIGRVVAEPAGDAQGARLRVAAEEVRWRPGASAPVAGDVLATTPPGDWRFGDHVALTGQLARPVDTDDVPLAEVLCRQGVAATMRTTAAHRLDDDAAASGPLALARDAAAGLQRAIFALKRIGGDTLDRRLPAPYAALARGLLLGGTSGMPAETVDAFRRAGLTHVVAVSGYNIALVAAALVPVSRLAGRRVGGLLWPSLGVLAFTVAVGAPASAVRAAVMGLLALLARYVGRPTDAVAGLAVASLVMTAADPGLLADLGFLLSSLATLALMTLYPWLDEHLPARGIGRPGAGVAEWTTRARFGGAARSTDPAAPPSLAVSLLGGVRELVATTLAVELLTVPLIAVAFGRFAVLSVVANVLVLPVVPVGMFTSFLVAATAPLPDALAAPLAWTAWVPLAWIVGVAETIAAPDWASPSIGRLAPAAAWGYYALAGLLMLGLHARSYRRAAPAPLALGRRLLEKAPAPLAVGGALLTAVAAWSGALAASDGAAHLTFFEDSGAVLLRTVGGRAALFAPGADGRALAADLGRTLPFWANALDLVVLPEDRGEATDGVPELLRHYRVGQILAPGEPEPEDAGAPSAPAGSAARGTRVPARAPARRDTPSAANDRWREAARAAGVPVVSPAEELALALDGGARLAFLPTLGQHPGRSALLTVGSTRVLLLGDASAAAQRDLADLLDGPVDVVHVGTGSGTPLDPALRERADPRLALVRVRSGAARPAPASRPDDRLRILRSDDHGTIELTLRPAGIEVRSRR
jgi:competence protein ComEC